MTALMEQRRRRVADRSAVPRAARRRQLADRQRLGGAEIRPTADDDIVLFDARLAIDGLKYRFLKAKGLEYGEEQRDFTVAPQQTCREQLSRHRPQRGPGARPMRMQAAGFLHLKNPRGTPVRVMNRGRPDARVEHFGAPLKGLSRRSELLAGDPLLASILTNWIVEEDRITVRPGYIKIGQTAAALPVSTMISFSGNGLERLIAASGTTLCATDGSIALQRLGRRQLGVVILQQLVVHRLHHHGQRPRRRRFVGRHHVREGDRNRLRRARRGSIRSSSTRSCRT